LVSALHIGGSFSSVEIADCIYNILKEKKDKFILSKGHAGILQYL
jgi:transketolase N-terminal domain/subunit